MTNRYNDGLDDFDRDLLGHGPLRSQPLDDIPSHRQTLDYFPTPVPSHFSNTSDKYGTYEATLLPSPYLEPESVRSRVMADDVHHLPNTNIVRRRQQADVFREPHHGWLAGTPPIHSIPHERTSQTLPPGGLQGPGSSSPTTRVSSRKQRRVPAIQNRPPPTFDSSPSIQFTQARHESRPSSSTPVVNGIPLVSLRQALPDKFRAIFPYDLFNAVQSKCFDVVYHTNDNVVVAAPTGSGKTAILELAICKLALDRGNENFKIVYQAPTKALCSEKARDWEKKFSHMNLKCAELTGDTSQAEMRRVGDASIIVTTPEKWDSITRKWQDHRRLLQMVELFLIDEVHILKDIRGATLEAVVSRMKTIGANVRFLALSATVPNSDDIATWLGRNHTNQQIPAHREAFGEEFRPVKLQKFVYGFESHSNDFVFDRFLDQRLPGLISKHASQKPILVFCFTRRTCESTAAMLADFASGTPDGDKLWPIPSQRVPVVSRELQEMVKFGVAFHHAGLDAQDRAAIEQNFLKGQLGVICCTSTLAVGINLPCHTVVLKGTVRFSDDKLEEYSDLEVMQMLGRAGRPQFDDSATAIILTRAVNKSRYERMVSGQEILESTLHLNLIEHLNSEICLGTIHNLPSAKTWLGGTFLSVRLRRNPRYYQLTGGTTSSSQVDDKLEEICERDIKQLQDAELVADQGTFRCTEYGRAMSKYMVQFNTMKLLLQIPRGVGMETLITILSQASEFKEFRFKNGEKTLFREMNQSPLIMYPVKEVVTETRHKVSLMIQAHLGCVQYPDSSEAAKSRRQLMLERKLVFERLNRLVRAVIDCKGHDRDSVGTKTALELARALAAESWEGRATQLTQVPNIGPAGMRKLASKDIRTVLQLADKQYDEIERLMSRQPPFGKNLQVHLDKFPRLSVDAAVVRHRVQPRSEEEPVLIDVKATLRYLNRKGLPNWLNRVPALTFLAESGNGTLVHFWRGSTRKLDTQSGFELKFSVGLRNVRDRVVCHFSCEEIVGTIVSTTLEHKLSPSLFPLRPVVAEPAATFSDSRKADGEEYIDNGDIDDSDLILAAEQALAHASTKRITTTVVEKDLDDFPSVEELIELDSKEEEATDKFDNHLAGHDDNDDDDMDSTPMANAAGPVRLPNGKWQCNHICSGGAPTKSGKPCSHRCCREGLDKPRKRPPQRPKRKREEPIDDPVGVASWKPTQARPHTQSHGPTQTPASTQVKRQKVQGTLPWAPLTIGSADPSGSSKTPTSHSKAVDVDSVDLECIDLSFTDDEDDEIFKLLGNGPPLKTSNGLYKSSTSSAVSMEKTGNLSGPRATAAPSQPAPYTQTQAKEHNKPAAVSSTRHDSYFDDFLDNDDFSFLEDTLPSQRQTVPSSTRNAFKSGASDEMLYQGISQKFPETADVTAQHDIQGIGNVTRRDNGDSPGLSSVADVPGMCPDTSPGSSATAGLAVSLAFEGEGTAGADSQGLLRQSLKNTNEPAWVSECDPEIVDMLRGYVTFV